MTPRFKLVCLFGATVGLAACSAPETRQFEIRHADDFYTVTETRKPGGLFKGSASSSITVRVGGQDVPCAELPCHEEIRAAKGTGSSIDEARLPPPGADLTTE